MQPFDKKVRKKNTNHRFPFQSLILVLICCSFSITVGFGNYYLWFSGEGPVSLDPEVRMPTKKLLEIKSDLAILGGVIQGLDAAARTEAILHLQETVELLRLGHEAQVEARSPPKKIKLDETGAEPSASGDEWLINTDTFLNDDSTISEDTSINDVQVKEDRTR